MLAKAQVFTRVRPHAREGGHAARRSGESHRPDVKRLGAFDREGVRMQGGSGEHHFTYMDGVVLPEDDQETTYASVGLPDMLAHFLDGYNVTFLAYGQTGTGKTHTMFGSQLEKVESFSLDSSTMPEQWGLFPRAVVSALKHIQGRGKEYKLTVNVVELYMGECWDLLNNKSKVSRNSLNKWGSSDFGAFGMEDMEVSRPGDIARIIEVMNSNRVTRGTAMNDTSSRSHCVASLCLTRLLPGHESGQQVRRSTAMFADLAGSERVAKTLEEKGSEAAMEGLATNWDLYMFGRCIDLVVEAARRGKKPGKHATNQPSLLSQVMTKVIEGNSFLTMVVCLSQSDKNGGESWFSLQYGERLAGLASSLEPTRARPLDTLVRETAQALEQERAALARLDSTEAGRANPWHDKRLSMVDQLTAELTFLAKLE